VNPIAPFPDDQAVQRLAAYDEQLTHAHPDSSCQGAAEPPSSDWSDAFACVELLRRVWPERAEPAPRDGDPASEAPEDTPALGRFRLLRKLGEGGCGVVFLAHDPLLERQVALKMPRPELLLVPEGRQRFLREGQAAAGLDHPHIVPVFEAGEVGLVCYLTSAFCPGVSLKEWLRGQGQPASPRSAAGLVAALAEAVHYTHQRGMLHRDLKPSNILLFPGGEGAPDDARLEDFVPRITDFGLAKLQDVPGEFTRSGAIVGTPQYMAPEQAEGNSRALGPPTDVYALGVILYETLTGRVPFRGTSDLDTLQQIKNDEPIPPRRLRNDTPRDLEAICLKCLEKAPPRRYAAAGALADDLRRYLAGQPTQARPVGPTVRWSRWARRHPAAAGLLASAVLTMLLGVSGLVMHNVRLNDLNAGLGQAKIDLESALTDARTAEKRATQSEEQTQELLYIADMRLAARAWKDGDMREMVDRLRRHIPRASQPDRRDLGWRFLWSLADVRPELFAVEPDNCIYYLQISPDGRLLASAGKDAVVRIYDLANRRLQQSIATGQKEVNGVAFSGDGRRLASAGDDGTVRVWNLADQTEVLRIAAHPRLAFQVRFTADDTMLISCGNDPIIRLWDARSGVALGSLSSHQHAVECTALSADGRWLASGGADAKAVIWDLAQRREHHSYSYGRPFASFFSGLVFTPDSQWLASVTLGNTLRVWNAQTGQALGRGSALDSARCVTVSPDGRFLASGHSAGMLCLWDLQPLRATKTAPAEPVQMTPARQWQGHDGRVYAACFTVDGRLITAGADGKIQTWPAAIALPAHAAQTAGKDLRFPCFTADKRLLALQGRTDVVGCVLQGGAPLEAIAPQKLAGRLMASNRNGELLAVHPEPGVIQLVSGSGELLASWRHAELHNVTWLALSPDGKWLGAVTLAPQRGIHVFETHSGKLQASCPLPSGSIGWLAFQPHASRVATDVDNELLLWDHQTGHQLRIPQSHQNLSAFAYSPDGTVLASGGSDRLVKLWDPQTGTLLATLSGHRGDVESLAFSVDGLSLVTAGADGLLKVWSVAARAELFDLYAHEDGGLTDLAISPDGRWLACSTSSDGRLLLLDLGARQP
jgi:WD40 repeat protein/serine/threonine protein kinase